MEKIKPNVVQTIYERVTKRCRQYYDGVGERKKNIILFSCYWKNLLSKNFPSLYFSRGIPIQLKLGNYNLQNISIKSQKRRVKENERYETNKNNQLSCKCEQYMEYNNKIVMSNECSYEVTNIGHKHLLRKPHTHTRPNSQLRCSVQNVTCT